MADEGTCWGGVVERWVVVAVCFGFCYGCDSDGLTRNGQLCCLICDVVVRVGDGALVDGVFTDVFTSNTFWCSCQSVAADECTGWSSES